MSSLWLEKLLLNDPGAELTVSLSPALATNLYIFFWLDIADRGIKRCQMDRLNLGCLSILSSSTIILARINPPCGNLSRLVSSVTLGNQFTNSTGCEFRFVVPLPRHSKGIHSCVEEYPSAM